MKEINRSAVITGASSGIGRAAALEFAKNGFKVALTARRKEALEEVAKACEEHGVQAFYVPMDITHENEVYEFARQADEKLGGIGVWVNNAAVAMMGPFEEMPMEDIRRLLDVNMMGCLYGCRAALPYFRKRKSGVLINLSSLTGLTGQPFSLAYTTSKAAVRGMTLGLQQELANEKNIHVCLVLPATVDTPLFQSAANYMGREVKAMEPVIDARSVAKEIVSLVKRPRPEIVVGGMGFQAALMKNFAPDLFNKMFNKQVQSKHFKETPSGPLKGNLYDPASGAATIEGGWLNGKEPKAIKMPLKNVMWIGMALAGVVAGAAAWLVVKK